MEKTDKAKIKVLVLDDQEDITEIDLKILRYYGFFYRVWGPGWRAGLGNIP